jgi:hypothetical protein
VVVERRVVRDLEALFEDLSRARQVQVVVLDQIYGLRRSWLWRARSIAE